MIFYGYWRIVETIKKNSGHLDLLFRQIEKLVIKVASFSYWVYFSVGYFYHTDIYQYWKFKTCVMGRALGGF